VNLTDYLNTFGGAMKAKHGEAVHKLAIDAAFTCPNRDGSKGIGGCTFCNNNSFSPNGRKPATISQQIRSGQQVIRKRTGAKKYIAYFQAYTNTYAESETLKKLYDQALACKDVIGISIGTRPDCLPSSVLDLLEAYLVKGYEVWLELGLQSSFNNTLDVVNRGHSYEDYLVAVKAARQRGIPVCTHLIIGLPGEGLSHNKITLRRVIDAGVDGLKLHPLHVVKGTQLANQWRRGEYRAISFAKYIKSAVELIEHTPANILFHRLTGTASLSILLTPQWCNKKWQVLNSIARELKISGSYQGFAYRGEQVCRH